MVENILNTIGDFWDHEEFIFTDYQQKCSLIKGWNELQSKIEDDLAQTESLKLSRHYKSFESEIKLWTSKLEQVGAILDVWLNVQRKWIYLEGIFFSSSDIAQ